jgi:hypothetical protein
MQAAIRKGEDAELSDARANVRPPAPMTIRRAAEYIADVDRKLAMLLIKVLDQLRMQMSVEDLPDFALWLSSGSYDFEPFTKKTEEPPAPVDPGTTKKKLTFPLRLPPRKI